jgi:hypothetical protein
MLIPARRLTTWTGVEGTRTTYAGEVSLLASPVMNDGELSTVMLAFNTTAVQVAAPEGVRLDFRDVLHLEYTGLGGEPPERLPGSNASRTIENRNGEAW